MRSAVGMSGCDPMYGPAARCKRFSSSYRFAVLHQCIRPLIGAFAPGHHGYQRACVLISGQALSGAIRVTSVRMRREDRSSISSYSSRRPRLETFDRITSSLAPHFAQFLCSCLAAVPSSRPAGAEMRRAQGPSRLAVALALPLAPALPAAILNPPPPKFSACDLPFDFGGWFGVYQSCHEGPPIWEDEIGGDGSDVFKEAFSGALGLAGFAP